MNILGDLFSRKNLGQLILAILFVVYLSLQAKTPPAVADMVDTLAGKIVVIVVALFLFSISNPILGILGFFVAYQLIVSSSIETGNNALDAYLPTENKKMNNMTAINQFPYTLEQEVVKKMAPLNQPKEAEDQAEYRPILNNLNDAAPINYDGVV